MPADKGKATVIMDKEEYTRKLDSMVNDTKVYEKLDKDPTPKFRKKMISILSRLKEEGKISQKQYTYLYPTSDMIPRLYGSPKIHKDGIP